MTPPLVVFASLSKSLVVFTSLQTNRVIPLGSRLLPSNGDVTVWYNEQIPVPFRSNLI